MLSVLACGDSAGETSPGIDAGPADVYRGQTDDALRLDSSEAAPRVIDMPESGVSDGASMDERGPFDAAREAEALADAEARYERDGAPEEGDSAPPGDVTTIVDAGRVVLPEDPRWPSARTVLPECTGAPDAFSAPDLPPPTGEVALLRQALLEPVGYDVRMAVEVRSPATGELDGTAQGALVVVSDDAIASAEPVEVAGGRAEVIVRFATEGTRTITATLADGRTGSAQIQAFASRLPVWELVASQADLDAVLADPGGTLKAAVGVKLGGGTYTGKVRLHGGSSRYYPKKSLRIDLASGQAFTDGSTHAILRAEWNDKTMLRNYLASEVMRNGTWAPSFRTEPVHLRINQQYYGVMWRAQRIDKEFLVERGLSTTASLYEADPPLAVAVPGGNLTPLASREAYPVVYQHHAGDVAYDDLVALIEQTLTLPADLFALQVTREVAVDDVLVFLAGMAVIQNHDHIRKNYYLYRDPQRDVGWSLLPWDLDLTFGHLYTEEAEVLDEQIFTDESLYFGERVPAHDFYNQLTTRLLAIPAYRSKFVGYAQHIAGDVLSDAFIEGRLTSFLCRATPDVLADVRKRATNDEYLGRIDEIRGFVRARRAFVEGAVDATF